jgi:hypothetical protein
VSAPVTRRLFAVIAVVSFVVVIGLGLGMTFFSDEWAFLTDRSLLDPSTWWPPHNEHWTTLPVIVYRLMVETIGIGSYVPYLVVVALLHLLVASLVYLVLERSTGPLIALLGGSIVLFFGSGFENLYWGFQTEFVASVALGLAAMLATDREATIGRAFAVAVLLLGSLACSGIGIPMSVAVGLEWLMTARWRRFVPVLAIPAATYAVWFLTAGRAGLETFRDPLTAAALLDVPGSVVRGLSNAVGSVTGLPGLKEIALVVTIAGATWWSWRRRRVPIRAVAILAAVTLQYALTGAVRAHLFEGIIDYTRYTYVSGILALVALGDVIGPVDLPRTGARRLVAVGVVAGWVALALTVNIGLLVLGRQIFLDRADMTRALVTVALDPARPPGVDLERSLVLVPSPARLEPIVGAYGDPRSDVLAPWAVRPIPPDILAEARRRLIEGAPIPRVSD